jgi:site-specific DNA-methyltransferase (adenine-specific)
MEYKLHTGNCLHVLSEMEENSVDTVITDPPYGLHFMGRDWDHGVPGVAFWEEVRRVAKPGAFLLAFGGTRTHHRLMVAIEDAGWEIRDTITHLHSGDFQRSAFLDSLDAEQKRAYLDLHYPGCVMAWVQGQGFPKGYSLEKGLRKKLETAIEEQGYEFTEWVDE